MRAIVEKEKKHYKRVSDKHELTRVEPTKLLFKVVVNNYNQEEKEMVDKIEEDADEIMVAHQIGLPPQPTSYIKYPKYDWF